MSRAITTPERLALEAFASELNSIRAQFQVGRAEERRGVADRQARRLDPFEPAPLVYELDVACNVRGPRQRGGDRSG